MRSEKAKVHSKEEALARIRHAPQTLRDNLSAEKREAHSVLDRVRAGLPVAQWLVTWALVVLGEPV